MLTNTYLVIFRLKVKSGGAQSTQEHRTLENEQNSGKKSEYVFFLSVRREKQYDGFIFPFLYS